jgi:hypothetical protein
VLSVTLLWAGSPLAKDAQYVKANGEVTDPNIFECDDRQAPRQIFWIDCM